MTEMLHEHISKLVAEERELEEGHIGVRATPEQEQRLQEIQVALDQYWDLLRQTPGTSRVRPGPRQHPHAATRGGGGLPAVEPFERLGATGRRFAGRPWKATDRDAALCDTRPDAGSVGHVVQQRNAEPLCGGAQGSRGLPHGLDSRRHDQESEPLGDRTPVVPQHHQQHHTERPPGTTHGLTEP